MPNRPARHWLATLALCACGSAAAETSPYYVGASAGINYDSNVQRLTERAGDRYYSVGLLGGLDQPIGRQRVYASGSVRNNKFETLKFLDNTSYGLNTGVDWATIGKLSGTLGYSTYSNLINYGGTNSNPLSERIVETSRQTLASVQYGMASLLSLQGSLTRRSQSFSDPLYALGNDLTQNIASVGVTYRPSGGLTLGSALRFTRGDYRNADSTFDRRDIDLTALWVPSGLSTLNTRLSFGRQNADDAANNSRDFSGATGFLSWQYQPTGKLLLNTWLSRDTGAETAFFNPNPLNPTGRSDNSQFTNTVALDATYAATGKIRATASVRTSRRALAFGTLAGNDTINGMSLGATYTPLRNVQLSCSVAQEKRSSNSVLSSPYSSRSAGCSAQITLQ